MAGLSLSSALSLSMSPRAGGGAPPVPIATPATFAAAGDVIPFTISRQAGGAIITDYSADAVRPTPTATYYVSTSGNINNNGTSEATPVNSISCAVMIAKAAGGTACIKIAAGKYKRGNGAFTRSGQPTANGTYRAPLNNLGILDQNIILEPLVPGTRWISMIEIQEGGITFAPTADPNIKVGTWSNAFPGVLWADWNNLDADGIPRLITPLLTTPANPAAPWPEINALWTAYSAVKDKPADASSYGMGASWVDTVNLKVYVRTFDNRLPVMGTDVDILCNDATLRGAETAITASRTMWMRGGMLMGGKNGALHAYSSSTANVLTLYADDMVFWGGYGYGAVTTVKIDNSLTPYGGKFIMNNCKGYYSLSDGFNWHGSGTGTVNSPFVIEIGSKSKWCGWNATGTNNGTTSHETVRKICINGEYLNTQDRAIHDIQASMNWYLGCTASTRRIADASVTSRIVVAQNPAQVGTTTTWLDTFTPVNGAFGAPQAQYDAYSSGVILFATNMTVPGYSPAGGGSAFAAYTP